MSGGVDLEGELGDGSEGERGGRAEGGRAAGDLEGGTLTGSVTGAGILPIVVGAVVPTPSMVWVAALTVLSTCAVGDWAGRETGIGTGELDGALPLEGERAEDVEVAEGVEGTEGREGAEGVEGTEGREEAEGVEGTAGPEGAEGVEGAEAGEGLFEAAGGAALPVACVTVATVWPAARPTSEAALGSGLAVAGPTQMNAPSRPSTTPLVRREIVLWE